MFCPVMQCYDNRGDRGDCDEKEISRITGVTRMNGVMR